MTCGCGDGKKKENSIGRRCEERTDARVEDGERAGVLVGLHFDLEALVVAERGLVGQRLHSDFVDGVVGVGNELAQEDVARLVQRVHDDLHQPVHLGLELLFLAAGRQRFLLLIGEAVWVGGCAGSGVADDVWM